MTSNANANSNANSNSNSNATATATAILILLSGSSAGAAVSTAADRKEVAITVYNDNFGLVRETREIAVGQGSVALELRDVAALIQPETVSIKSLAGENALVVREQNFRYDLLTPRRLLEKNVGKRVRLYRYNAALGRDEAFDADVIAAPTGDPVLKIGNQITAHFPGRIAFPEMPKDLAARPTLVWLLDSNVPSQRVEITYLTSGIKWRSDYVVSLAPTDSIDTTADVTGWVTLDNRSGATFEDARLKLVAGDVQRVHEQEETLEDEDGIDDLKKEDRPKEFKEESFFEYHLYTLDRATTLRDNETKQVTLFEARGVHVKKRFKYFAQVDVSSNQSDRRLENQKVSVYLEFENTEKNQLGIALPKGVFRVYKADTSGSSQFIGEDQADHTPRDEKVSLHVGEAFDVSVTEKQTAYRVIGKCAAESETEVSLRNHKSETVSVEILERVSNDWDVVSSTHAWTKHDAQSFTLDPEIKPNAEVKVTVRVRYHWC